MPKLNIPEDGFEGLHYIASLDEDRFKRMLEGLSQLPPTVYHIGRVIQCIAKSTGLAEDISSSIGQALSGLGLVFSRGQLNTDEFANEVLKAVSARVLEGAKDTDEEVFFSKEDVANLTKYLPQLLRLESLLASAVALDTSLEVERPLLEARVFADLRPVFARKGETSISAFAITTTLKVAWFDPTGNHETYFTLDEADVDSLLAALSEAKKQAAALRDFVQSSGARCVELGERE